MQVPKGDRAALFTWARQDEAVAYPLQAADGVWLKLADGKRLLDLGSTCYQASLGHGQHRIMEAMANQVRRLPIALPHATYPEKTALTEALLELAPPEHESLFFTLGGAEANENAIKFARLVTGRHKIIARYRSYHGATFGAVALTGDWRRPPVEPALPGVVHVSDTACDQCPGKLKARNCNHPPLTRIPEAIELEGPETIAAVIIEPISGSNGVVFPPAGYLEAIAAACRTHGILLIVDEVLTGFHRTGPRFAFEHWAVTPHMITMAKALTAGYAPLGAVTLHRTVVEGLAHRVLPAGLTHYAPPVSVAAALAALTEYEHISESHRQAIHRCLDQSLQPLKARVPPVTAARIVGALAGLQLQADRVNWPKLKHQLREAGLHVHVHPKSAMVVLAPPLVMDTATLEQGLHTFAQVMDGYCAWTN